MKCIYHRIDADGVASAALIKMYSDALDLNCQFIGFDYSDDFNTKVIADEETVFIVDCSLTPGQMKELYDRANIIWIDHHKSAIDDSFVYGYSNMKGIRFDAFAACELVHRYLLHQGYKPTIKYRFLNLIGLYDCFAGMRCDAIKDEVFEFQLGMRSLKVLTIDKMIQFLEGSFNTANDSRATYEYVMGQGEIYKDFLTDQAREAYDKGLTKYYNDKKCLLYSGDRLNLANYLDEDDLDLFDFLVNYDNAIGGRGTVSLYSTKIDVSVIAKEFNGGGHKGASGIPKDRADAFISLYLKDKLSISSSSSEDLLFS